jgi:methylmalonyl-CoA mutase cobalamin-binding subunit
MTSSVLLIGFQDQDNLGLRYLLSSVRHAGFRGEIATYTADPAPICQMVARRKPDVVGFSLIFQYMAPEFGRVIEALRAAGCRARSAAIIRALITAKSGSASRGRTRWFALKARRPSSN